MNYLKYILILSLYLVLLTFVSVEAYSQEPVNELFSVNYGKPQINYEKIIFSTVFIIVIVFIALILIKKFRFNNIGQQSLIEVVHNYPITSKDKLLIVKVASEYLLLGSSNSGIRKLHALDANSIEKIVSQKNIKKHEFANILANTLGKGRNA